MKKIVLSLAGVMATVAFAPEASAIPAFARQTGMACSACHAQHFPVLNGFGRAFKAAGFTMMGAQEKVEGEHLSIPASLNASTLLKVRYQKTNGTVPAGEVKGATTNSGQWQFPDEFSLFFGGRVADNGEIKVGMMMENGLAGNAVATPGIAAGLRVPVVAELDAATVSVIPFTTDSLGPFYGYTESSTGVNRAIRWAEHRKEISAYQYTGMGNGASTGLAFVAHSDMGYINYSRFNPAFASKGAQTASAIELALTPTIADFATVLTLDILTGTAHAGTAAGKADYKGTGLTAQGHGEVAGIETGLYATYAKADAAGFYGDKKAFTLGADFTVIPHTLSVGAAIRSATNAGTADNATTLTAVYDLAQNVAVVANFTKYGTEQFDNTTSLGDNLLTMMLEAAW
jgi:hypothetical protein